MEKKQSQAYYYPGASTDSREVFHRALLGEENEMGIKHSAAGEVTRLVPQDLDFAAAKSTALVKTKDFEAIRLCLHAGQEIPAHKAEGPITVQCLAGRLVFTVDETPHEITAGDWLYLEGSQVHALRGLEDSVLLLTIIFV